MRSKKLYLMMLLMIVAVLSAACSGGSKSASADKDEAKKADNAEIKILSTEYTLPDDSTTKLADGELILKVKVSIKNTGKEPLSVTRRSFNLYHGDSKVTDVNIYDAQNERLTTATLNSDKSVDGYLYYQVEKGEKYQLEYAPETYGDEKIEPIEFEIDGGSSAMLESAKKLDDPAKALLAYTDITLFGKDNEDFEKLTGENKREIVTDYIEGGQKSLIKSMGIYNEEDVDKKKLNKLISAIQNAYQDKAKVKAVTKTMTSEEAKVEATITPIDSSDTQKRVQKRMEEYVKDSGKNYMSREELINPTIDVMAEELKKVETASNDKTVEVTMKKTKDGKWQLDLTDYDTEDYFSSFFKN
ncbi:DUF5105 domain-containing protein [Bacillus sonorensis]|nr:MULTISPECIES: DUF5105 domain-containing protein [Bacillus]ASB91203.1 putative lipoprotein YcdA [Bacillus sonorensis]MCY7857101.1 DUF4352 domain-containing protein [Bacillus sonorensis]MCY8086551.1 DUF4352 domain-containing protein [Bacillus sonorensis]MCY8404471.1 DUF4352 domain-containing protein [Bacillus sonorensis]MCZ0074134.1 DUF5105 domain-containing protein [Bacillus sonorensis]